MGRIYPVFTDGKKFWHSNDIYPEGCRFAYFSVYDLKEWKKKEEPQIKDKAKSVFNSWDKKLEEKSK